MFLSFTSNSLLAIDVVDAFMRAWQKKAPLTDVPKALDDLWYTAMQGSLYSLVAFIGLFIAVMAVGFWCVKFYIALDEGNMKPVVAQMVWPLLIVILLANGGANMRKLTMGTRDILNAVNYSVNEVVSTEVDVKTAIMAMSGNYEIKKFFAMNLNLCNQNSDLQKFQDCMKTFSLKLEAKQNGYVGVINKVVSSAFKLKLDPWTKQTEGLKQSVDKLIAATPKDVQQSATSAASNSGTTNTNGETKAFNPLKIETYSAAGGIDVIVEVMTSARTAFIYILEAMMLVTGLIGPIFVGLSLFPVGTKPMVAWAVSFVMIGFCKICYSLISGLATIAMVYAGPENADMTVASVVLGLMSPVLSFYVASNSGFSALTTVSYTTQSIGLNSGISSYGIGRDGNSSTPKSSTNSNKINHTTVP